MRRSRFSIAVFSLVLMLATATSAAAQHDEPRAKTPDFSAHEELEDVAGELHRKWSQRPELFAELHGARQFVTNWYQQRGSRAMNVARTLQGLGDDALLPMLWALVADDPFQLGMTLRAWRSWRVGLLEAVGRLRDERSLPVLLSIIAGNDPHEPVRQTATSALGRVGDTESIAAVIDIARHNPDKREAIIAGLGDARRQVALQYLLEIVGSEDHAEYHRAAIRALGDWANQWAWQTSTRSPYRQEGEKGRRAVIDTLVDAYPDADEMLRQEIEKSLQLAGAEASRKRAAERAERTGDAGERELWKTLAGRLAESPLQ